MQQKISKAQTPPFQTFFPKANLKLAFLWKTRMNEKILKSHAMCIQVVTQVFAEP